MSFNFVASLKIYFLGGKKYQEKEALLRTEPLTEEEEELEQGQRRFYVLSGIAMLAIGYGLILNVFKRKYQGYPYSFFLG